MRLIIDSHLDLAWNALSFNRDQKETVAQINERERHMDDQKSRSRATTSLPELRKAGAAVVLATILCRAKREVQFAHGMRRWDLDFGTQEIAYGMGRGQLAYYEALVAQGELAQIFTVADLDAHWQRWQAAGPGANLPVGFILAMEGTDPIIEPRDAEEWWRHGLRSATLSHYGKSHYSVGTGDNGPLTAKGVELLKEFDRLGMILDLTHMSDISFFQALDQFRGPVMASHNNCRELVPGDRQFSDEQIKLLVSRGAVIGAVLDAWMLVPDYNKAKPDNSKLTMAAVVDHIDRVCQLAGNVDHAAIGSDLDGGFGHEQTPGDFKVYSDLHKLEGLLADRGYGAADIDKIFYGNWLRFFRQHLPKG